MEQHHEHELRALKWLAGARAWETTLGVLRARHQSTIARSASPEIHTLNSRKLPIERGQSEPRIDRVA